MQEYAVNDSQGGVRRFGVKYRDGRYDRRGHGFLGFGERIVTDLDTNAGTATFFDNVTVASVGDRDVYPFANQMHRQWRWAPALPHESKQNRVELAFAAIDSDVVPTNDGQTYFTLSTKRRTRRMQGTSRPSHQSTAADGQGNKFLFFSDEPPELPRYRLRLLGR